MSKDLKLCNKIPTIVAFTAKTWCNPCQRFEPELEKLKTKHDGINHHTVQCDQSDSILGKYIESFSIEGYPTIMIYLPHPKNKFVLYDGKREEMEIKKFIKKAVDTPIEDLVVWTKIPQDIEFVDHGDSCAKL